MIFTNREKEETTWGDPSCEANGVYRFEVAPVGLSFRKAGPALDKYVAPFWR